MQTAYFETFHNDHHDTHKKSDISHFSINEIRPADENVLLYDNFTPNADEDDRKLYFSIKENGIREPLHISVDGVILSGHRRYAVATWLGLDTVPCIVAEDVIYSDLSKEERIRVLAVYNKQRDKSNAERLREAMQEIDPDDVYENLLIDRKKRRQVRLDDNIIMGKRKKRARIMTKAFLAAAQKVIESEREFWPITDRRVHYLLLNDPPLRHDKKPDSIYRNDKNCYKALTNLLTRARLTGDIPHESIGDELRPIRVLATYQNPADYIQEETQGFLRHYARDLLRGQENHIEILVEKNAIRKHIESVADEYCIPCTTGRGFSSLPPRYEMFKRFKASGKAQLVLLILSDFDPDGEEIAASFSRSLRDDFGLKNIQCHKVGLSGQDVIDYNLPSDLEAKENSPNYNKFVERHGTHVAELDAAPAGLLQEKLRTAIESSLDMGLFLAEMAQERTDAAFIAATKKSIQSMMTNC
jgi:hypothetical protein